jgi:phospholipase D1/2
MSGEDVNMTDAGKADAHHEHRSLKDKIAHPFPHVREKIKHSHAFYDAKVKAIHTKNKIGKFKNLVNPNHRHDEEHEQETDRKREQVCGNHRFNSFAPERDGNLIKWYIDGRDYFWVSTYPLRLRATYV